MHPLVDLASLVVSVQPLDPEFDRRMLRLVLKIYMVTNKVVALFPINLFVEISISY